MLNRVLDLGDVELEVWYADRDAVPSWAAQAVGIRAVGVFDPFYASYEAEMRGFCDRYITSFTELL